MIELAYILISTIMITFIAFIGIFTLSINENILKKIVLVLVSLSAGALMGGAFLHLIPESIEVASGSNIFIIVLIGFIIFFIIEKILHWRHCHDGKCDVHTFHYMNLIGDSIHNFIDGLIIAAGFMVSIPLGFTTTIAIVAHEIPQEIGDFGVLIYGGFEKKKALILNFLVAFTIVIGGFVGYLLSNIIENYVYILLSFAAGGFIYIAATDLIPEIKKEVDIRKSTFTMLIFILGIVFMWIIKIIL
ncbi:MAG: ZIP family metal transporter [Candidatus Thermoplasmatota archaeon]|nr:ZIP family metal transporter [Candidatus Thermoplasmatota archaeon]